MIYFQTKSDLEAAQAFYDAVINFWALEERRYSSGQRRASWNQEEEEQYQQERAAIARQTPRIARLARTLGVHADIQSYPAPAVGGPVIPVNLFYAILNDDSHGGIERQRIMDAANELIGQLEDKQRREFKYAVNPLFWLGLVIERVLSSPFWLLSKTGFNLTKIEDNLWGKLFKVLEVAAIGYLAVKYGLPIAGGN